MKITMRYLQNELYELQSTLNKRNGLENLRNIFNLFRKLVS